MILSNRVQRSPHHTSYPTNSELAPSFSSPELRVSPLATQPRGHKHTLSKKMSWLSRSSSSTSNRSIPQAHAAPKPTRISEPKFGNSLEQFTFHRSGPLGSGATIVRTPQEALSGSSRAFKLMSEEQEVQGDTVLHNTEKHESRLLPPLPSSPPLPPLPDMPDAEGEGRLSVSSTRVPLSDHVMHPPPSDSPSPPAQRSSSRPTLLPHPHSRAPSRSTPTLPADADPIPPPPPFEAILISSIPDGAIDPSKLIVTLETCTTTYRTSLRSLVSRPSHLSRYVTSLLSPGSETASLYSNASEISLSQHSNWFNSLFRDHLASSGCLPQSSSIHIFLDRPSAPYTHVFAYLRSPPEQPETLPRAVQLGSMSPSRLESLLELRDEASYLGLDELYALCCHEINRSHRSPLPTAAGRMLRGKTGSVHSLRTLVEQCQPHQEAKLSELRVSKGNSSARTAKSATRESSSSSSCENKDVSVRERSRQVKGSKYEMGSPPPGWI
ncbi:hypothetical protein J3R82DRAFT_4531 [Butyriboletus roseoflavus]|nr:hypothetical protein J3R82DRAFT_4531 [Butyriboletus roseoflavus]